MKTPIQIREIKETILYILQSFKDGVDYIKLFKILYFAQQKHLVKYGKVIVEDTFRARRHGPVPSFLYKALKEAERGQAEGDIKNFLTGIVVFDQKVYAKTIPDMDWISIAEKAIIDETIEKYGNMDSQTLSEKSHDSAWEKAMQRMEDDPQKDILTIIDIARAGNASEAMIDYIREKQIVEEALA